MTDLQKTISLTVILVTIAVLMAGVVFLPAFGRPIEAAPASAITTIFISTVTAILASLGLSKVNALQMETALANLRAQNAETRVDEMTYQRGETLRPSQALGMVTPHGPYPPPPAPIVPIP